jgi:hypothetical protein
MNNYKLFGLILLLIIVLIYLSSKVPNKQDMSMQEPILNDEEKIKFKEIMNGIEKHIDANIKKEFDHNLFTEIDNLFSTKKY